MTRKSVSQLIFDKFAEKVKNDDLFKGISDDLIALVRKRASEKEIRELFGREQDEDSESGN